MSQTRKRKTGTDTTQGKENSTIECRKVYFGIWCEIAEVIVFVPHARSRLSRHKQYIGY